jgi:hypothetical protein
MKILYMRLREEEEEEQTVGFISDLKRPHAHMNTGPEGLQSNNR